MNYVNEYIEPGPYQHYKGSMYVVLTIVTHLENSETNKMEPLQDPLVVYRDLENVPRHIKGKMSRDYTQHYARKLSEFNATISGPNGPVKRFTQMFKYDRDL